MSVRPHKVIASGDVWKAVDQGIDVVMHAAKEYEHKTGFRISGDLLVAGEA